MEKEIMSTGLSIYTEYQESSRTVVSHLANV